MPVDAGFDSDLNRSGSYQTFLWMLNLIILVSASQDGTPRRDRARENRAAISNSSFRDPDSQISPDPTRGDLGSTFEGMRSKALPACLHMCRAPEQDDRTVPCSRIRWGKDACREGSRECPSPSSWDVEVCRETFLEEGPELWHGERALPGKSARQSYEGGSLHAGAVERQSGLAPVSGW